MCELVIATQNPGKLQEIRQLVNGANGGDEDGALPVQCLELRSAWASVVPEEGEDYEANARAKALAVARVSGRVAVADDSGLEVDALGGAPGPLSARYGGPGLDDRGRSARLLEALRGVAEAQRGARFVCVAAVAAPDGASAVACGTCQGRILETPRGLAGFGYDPIFWVDAYGRAAAELSDAEKHEVSHRGRAFRALLPQIRTFLAAS